MHLLTLLRTIDTLNLRRIAGMAVVAALSNAFVLALINSAANLGNSHGDQRVRLALMFAIVVVIFTISQQYLMIGAAKEVQGMIHRIRSRMIEAVRQSELPDIESIGSTRILNGTSKEIQTIAQASNIFAVTFQMALLVVFTTIYLMSLSMTAFLLAVGFMSLAITLYLGRAKRMTVAIQEAASTEYGLHEQLTSMLDGFKEIKLNNGRSQALGKHVVASSSHAAVERARADTEYARNYIFAQNIFFLLLGTMVFIVPVLSEATAYNDTLLKTTTAVLFVMGPISCVVGAMPILANANNSAAHIIELERLLVHVSAPSRDREAPDFPPPTSFSEIEFRNIKFHFEDTKAKELFQVGPVNLKLRAGELVFISGGNGSGKSTFLRLLTALYWPQAGTILVDGRPVTHSNVESYRALFSAVFSDYHLFKQLYGIEPAAAAEASELLRLFEIKDKTNVQDAEFTTIDLSAGQRKRLALIVAMLEHRPICVLDEWAADQDPIFRRKFYSELVGMLKARGITVIAVSHDDRYYDCAERRLHMEEGKVFEGQESAHA